MYIENKDEITKQTITTLMSYKNYQFTNYIVQNVKLVRQIKLKTVLGSNIIKYLTTPFENGSVLNKSLRGLSELTAQQHVYV